MPAGACASFADLIEPMGLPLAVKVNRVRSQLTMRQREALELMCEGMSKSQMAQAMYLQISSVRNLNTLIRGAFRDNGLLDGCGSGISERVRIGYLMGFARGYVTGRYAQLTTEARR